MNNINITGDDLEFNVIYSPQGEVIPAGGDVLFGIEADISATNGSYEIDIEIIVVDNATSGLQIDYTFNMKAKFAVIGSGIRVCCFNYNRFDWNKRTPQPLVDP